MGLVRPRADGGGGAQKRTRTRALCASEAHAELLHSSLQFLPFCAHRCSTWSRS